MSQLRLLAVACAAILTSVPTAHAYEDQIAFGVDLGVVHVADLPRTTGPSLGLSLGYGIGDAWALNTRLGYAAHISGAPTTTDADVVHSLCLQAEVVYLIDVLAFVPFVGLGVTGLLVTGNGTGGNVGVHAVIGGDYLVSRALAIGFDVRPGFLPFEPGRRSPQGFTFQGGVRVSWLFSTW